MCISPFLTLFEANAVGKGMVPYFAQIMENLKIYLTGELSGEEMPLQVQALGQ